MKCGDLSFFAEFTPAQAGSQNDTNLWLLSGTRVTYACFFRLYPLPCWPFYADVVKLVDTLDLGSSAARRGGSSPSIRTSPQTIAFV